MKNDYSIRIPNTLDGLTAGAAGMREFLGAVGVSAEVAFALDLAYEELVTNTIKYSYADSAPHDIDILVLVDDDSVELEVCDDGQEFDPTIQAPPDTTLPVEDRPIGGLGLHLIRNLTDAFTYRRSENKNFTRIRKRRI
jgi:serine/threonine-protein kinase RsbW